MYTRFIQAVLKRKLGSFPALMLVGPRQSGKTTLTKNFAQELGITYASFDVMSNLISAQLDPPGFIEALKKPLILDEIQRAPEIFLPIKVDIDNNRHPGRYILTGSANPLLVPKMGDALTGRMAICHMWPLSQNELLGNRENFIDRIFSDYSWNRPFNTCNQEELIQKLFLGGFPALHIANTDKDRREWCNEYLSLSLQKDINDLSKIESFAHLPALLYGLAARVGSTVNYEELGRIARTASTSLRRYIQLLENLFLLYRLPAWHFNIDKRLTKAPKIHFSDTALLLTVLGLNKTQLASDSNILGHILENFVIMECVKQSTWSEINPELFHYRREKEKGTEVDLVIEFEGNIVGLEVKLSSLVRPDDLTGLKSLKTVAGKAFKKGIILYTGNQFIPLGEELFAIPINALWCD